MAYNYYQPYYQPQQNPQMQPQQTQQSGFVSVRSEQEARNYPVAYGNSVTFKDENAPYIYTKTMGFSQLDRPIFDRYKLVKEESTPEVSEMPQNAQELEQIRKDIKELQNAVKELKEADTYGA